MTYYRFSDEQDPNLATPSLHCRSISMVAPTLPCVMPGHNPPLLSGHNLTPKLRNTNVTYDTILEYTSVTDTGRENIDL